MANKTDVIWIAPPAGMAKALERYGDKVLVAVQAVAEYIGLKMQNEARTGARWEDRSSNARGGIIYAVDGFGLDTLVGEVKPGNLATFGRDKDLSVRVSGSKDKLIVALGHTMFYGQFLELSNGGKYAIIMSTIEANLPELKRLLDGLFR